MDIDQHVNQIVQNIVSEITNKVQAQASDAITKKVNEVISAVDYTSIIADKINQQIVQKLNQLPIDAKAIEGSLTKRVDELAQSLYNTVQKKSVDIVNNSINSYVKNIDFNQLSKTTLLLALENQEFKYPNNAIPPEAVQKNGFILSGDNIVGGIITKFGSTGIDDKATGCQLTVMDEVTVVENNLLTKDLTVKGSATIEGDINITGRVDPQSAFYKNLVSTTTEHVRDSLNSSVFEQYSGLIFEKIKKHGVDLDKLSVNGQDVVTGNALGQGIINSNLTKLGTLRDLTVNGETFLGQTIYISTKRVGINTIEPTQALSVWDQEVEVGVGKLSHNTAVIGTPRNQPLVLSSNGKNNLTVLPEGGVSVDTIKVGNMVITTSDKPPNTDQPKGTIVFNENPSLGGPLGWVSLGGARWANFGIID